MHTMRFGLIALLLAFAAAAEARSGFYLGAEVGAAMPQDLRSTRTNIGVPTNCDQWLDGATLNDGVAVPLPLEQCAPRALPASPSTFDLDAGLLAGVNAGYVLGRFRIEAEYFHRRHGGEQLPLVVPGDAKQQEFVERSEEIDDLRSHNFFANLHYGFGQLGESRIAPYVGLGLGAVRTKMDYSGRSVRTSDRNALLNLGRNPNAAGRLSAADERLSDSLLGFQLLAGFDYALSERRALTVKLRYGGAFGDFEEGGNPWRPLRNHESTVGPGGAPIVYDVKAKNLSFWAVSVGFKLFAD